MVVIVVLFGFGIGVVIVIYSFVSGLFFSFLVGFCVFE